MEFIESGSELTRWAARLAVAGWVGWLMLAVGRCSSHLRRWAWTAGLTAHLVHVLCAFHFVHHWSHFEAVRHTARLTERVVGWDWGGGVWVNYTFTLAWLVDTAWWWRRPATELRSGMWSWFVNGFFAFLFFNATVVFGPWGWKPVGAVVVVAAAVLAGWQHRSAHRDLLEESQ